MLRFNPESKQQNLQWKSPTCTPPKAKVFKSAGKIMIIFFDHDGCIYKHDVLSDTGVTKQYLCNSFMLGIAALSTQMSKQNVKEILPTAS